MARSDSGGTEPVGDGETLLSQPLVSRPAYGQGRSNTPVATSGLPQGDPASHGRSLDKDIPGSSTHAKPEDDIRDFDESEDSSMYKVDGPDDLLKQQTTPDSIALPIGTSTAPEARAAATAPGLTTP